jgi:radical SAM superfamily enzyme YgiQ (UPF0313 family)
MSNSTIASYSKEKSIIKRSLKISGFNDIQFNNGFYYFSGFANKFGKTIYFSITDVRDGCDKVMIRTAKDNKDFTGGRNNFADINSSENISILARTLVA